MRWTGGWALAGWLRRILSASSDQSCYQLASVNLRVRARRAFFFRGGRGRSLDRGAPAMAPTRNLLAKCQRISTSRKEEVKRRRQPGLSAKVRCLFQNAKPRRPEGRRRGFVFFTRRQECRQRLGRVYVPLLVRPFATGGSPTADSLSVEIRYSAGNLVWKSRFCIARRARCGRRRFVSVVRRREGVRRPGRPRPSLLLSLHGASRMGCVCHNSPLGSRGTYGDSP
jgi:hypothetical protein